nr:hypothetical protein [Halobacterium sp. CBA1126]
MTTPDRAALADALRARSLAVELDAGLAAVAYNRAPEASEAVANALGAPVVAVPDADSVAAAMTAGRPVAAVDGEAEAVERFGALAERVRAARE